MLLDAGVRFKVTQEQRAVIRTLDRPDENLRHRLCNRLQEFIYNVLKSTRFLISSTRSSKLSFNPSSQNPPFLESLRALAPRFPAL
jgi:hypothetical protein